MKSIPNDENDEVLRRMHEGGDSFERPRVVDFCFAFPEREEALRFAAAVPEFDYEVCISRYEERQMWQAIVKRFMKPEHSEIGRIEADLGARAIAVGGEPDGWGCIRIEDLKKKADPVSHSATPLISPKSPMISPLNMAQSFKRDGLPARRAWLI